MLRIAIIISTIFVFSDLCAQSIFEYTYNPNKPSEYFVKPNVNGSSTYPGVDVTFYQTYKQKADSSVFQVYGSTDVDTSFAYIFMPYQAFLINAKLSTGTTVNFKVVLYMGTRELSASYNKPSKYGHYAPVDSMTITSEGTHVFRPNEHPFGWYYLRLVSLTGNENVDVWIKSGGYMTERIRGF